MEPVKSKLATITRVANSITTIATIAGVVAVGVILYTRRPTPPVRIEEPLPKDPVSLAGAATKGNPDARVAMIEYTDFECPFCARFANGAFREIEKEYVDQGRVVLALRHLPLKIHPNAQVAAEAVYCAGKQDKTWQMHDLLFVNQRRLDFASIRELAETLPLNTENFSQCMKGEMADRVLADVATADAAGVASTPSFLIGIKDNSAGSVRVTDRLSGSQPIEMFRRALDHALKVAESRNMPLSAFRKAIDQAVSTVASR